jgi:hypothetical protein
MAQIIDLIEIVDTTISIHGFRRQFFNQMPCLTEHLERGGPGNKFLLTSGQDWTDAERIAS